MAKKANTGRRKKPLRRREDSGKVVHAPEAPLFSEAMQQQHARAVALMLNGFAPRIREVAAAVYYSGGSLQSIRRLLDTVLGPVGDEAKKQAKVDLWSQVKRAVQLLSEGVTLETAVEFAKGSFNGKWQKLGYRFDPADNTLRVAIEAWAAPALKGRRPPERWAPLAAAMRAAGLGDVSPDTLKRVLAPSSMN